MSAFRVAYVPWWRPIRLALKHDNEGNHSFIGWVWRQRAYMVRNIHHGWIAYVDHQTPEKLACCPTCGREKP